MRRARVSHLPDGSAFCPDCHKITPTEVLDAMRYLDTPCGGLLIRGSDISDPVLCMKPMSAYVRDPKQWPWRRAWPQPTTNTEKQP